MKIGSCDFPDDLLYDPDGLVWVRLEPSGDVVLGVTAIQAAIAGRLMRITARPTSVIYDRGRGLGTIESCRYFGSIRTPVRGLLLETNGNVIERPAQLSERPYAEGWFARLRPSAWEQDRKDLRSVAEARDHLASQIEALHVHCFAAFPDYELVEIGTECQAVLTKLDETLRDAKEGEVVHLVSDDWTAPAEMVNWSQRTGYPVIEERKEGNLYHFLVRKITWD